MWTVDHATLQLNAARLRQPSFVVWLSTGLFKDGNPVELRLWTPWCTMEIIFFFRCENIFFRCAKK